MRKFVAFLTFILLAPIVIGASSSLRDIDLSDNQVKVGEEFDVEVRVYKGESNQKLYFHVDDYEFKIINVGPETGDVLATYDEYDWDIHELTCGIHTVWVELKKGDDSIDNISDTLGVGNLPKITLDPENMLVGKTNKISLTDRDSGKALSSVEIDIYNTQTGDITKKTTSVGGTVTFNPKNSGKYRLTISGGKYCGELEFYAKKKIVIDGPHPLNPVVNELVTVALPGGVGVKVLYQDGTVYKTGLFTTIGGGVNFTIEDAGSYILAMGDLSRIYWGRNVTINVSSKEVPTVTITPDKGTIGEAVTIDVKSGGQAVDGAYITVTAPDNSFDIYTTTSSGSITYTPSAIGDYSVKVEKARYDSVQKTFSARNELKIVFEPAKPKAGAGITMTVKNQLGNVVSDASVKVGDLHSGMTGSLGKYNFTLPEVSTYEVRVTKTRYWDYVSDITALGTLEINISKATIELGRNVTVGVVDQNGLSASPTITAIKEGSQEEISEVFTPKTPGIYNISVTKNGYIGDSILLEVLPHPIDVLFETNRNALIVKLGSRGVPVSGISVSLDGEESFSDEYGAVTFGIRTGEFDIGINQANTNESFEVKTLPREIAKDYSILLMVIPVAVIVVFALAAILFITGKHKKVYLVHEGLKKIVLKTEDEGALKKGKSRLSDL